jgi:hypothetical protein
MLACYTYAVMRLLWTSLGYCATMSQVAQMLPGGMRCVTRGIAHFRHVPMKHSSYLLCLDLTAELVKAFTELSDMLGLCTHVWTSIGIMAVEQLAALSVWLKHDFSAATRKLCSSGCTVAITVESIVIGSLHVKQHLKITKSQKQ